MADRQQYSFCKYSKFEEVEWTFIQRIETVSEGKAKTNNTDDSKHSTNCYLRNGIVYRILEGSTSIENKPKEEEIIHDHFDGPTWQTPFIIIFISFKILLFP